MIRSADLVISIAGGAGTLSELAIAWQEGKPIAAYYGSGGLSDRLAGQSLDHRREDTIVSCGSVDELVEWAETQRPEGVFSGRMNRGFYPLEVPAIHRIHEGEASGAHAIHSRFGMSVNLDELKSRLVEFDSQVREWDSESTGLVTFDDGWADVLLLEEFLTSRSNLTPVLFLPETQFNTPVRPLPMQRLYQHLVEQDWDGGPLREELKSMKEEAAHARLNELGVAPMLDPAWLLKEEDICRLSEKGWIIASHGHAHEDLRMDSVLQDGLRIVADEIEERGLTPWLAWPEGQWSMESVNSARSAGFTRQFGLLDEPHEAPPDGMIMRKIWS